MGLASCEVVLDTYNLRLTKGSGIKTYGLTLIESLRRLGASVSVLSDRVLPKRRDEVLDEVHFFDPPPIPSLLPQRLRTLVDVLRLATGPQRPVAIRMKHVIQSRSHHPISQADRIYNVSDVYDRAHRLYRLTGRRTTIDLGAGGGVHGGLGVHGGAGGAGGAGGNGAARRRLWHATTPMPVRVRGTPMITTVHDLIPLRLPYMTRDHKKTFYGVVDEALRDSCLVLAVSEFTKRDLLDLFDIDERKIVVTWETYSPSVPLPENVDQDVVLGQHGLRPREYVLYVGNVDPRKNLGVLFQAMSAVPHDLPLVIAGRKSDRWDQEIEAAQAHLGVYDQRRLRRRLRLLDYVPAALLQVLYRNALCLVMPSLYEGFGLPVLEAMRHDCPVVCANRTSLPEIAGDAALYFDPERPYELSAQILALAGDKSRRPAMIDAGRAQAARFSPEEYTARVSAAYDQALARVS